ncbi:YeiH family protein [Rothia sp. P7181]|uniref:YeiH family protein n=1 Tax=Rothia sp. P7181 TaxID=3402663 RepID=UPI003AD9DEC7
MFSTFTSRLHGILFAIALTVGAYLITFIPGFQLVSVLLLAIVLGILMRNVGLIPDSCSAGLTYSSKTFLRVGVVLLGLRLAIPDILELGWGVLFIIAVTVLSTYLVTLWCGRLMGVAHNSRMLIATGTAICGASAVAGMSAVLEKKDDSEEDVESSATTAIACVTLFGTFLMFLIPALAVQFGLSSEQAGVWIGTSIHEVGQVVAGAGFIGTDVVATATVTKLGRVVLLAPLVAYVGYRQGQEKARRGVSSQKRPPLLPLFVVGFLIAVFLRSVLSYMGFDGVLSSVLRGAEVLSTVLITVAMGAMGTNVHLRKIMTTGLSAVVLGAVASVVAAVVSLVLVLVIM